ncbi:GTP-binding protein Rho1 [Phlyctochytrium bullatum]|nr:GTP-binding protein Rho1 [Phlyctochytrium bullatum]
MGEKKKLVVVGDGACGKTCLLIVYSTGQFPEVYVPTVFENYDAVIYVDGRTVDMSLWDTAGQEGYDRLRPFCYPDSNVVLICFSVDSPDSLQNVKDKWISEVIHYCRDTPIVLVACKSDLRRDHIVVETLKANNQNIVTPSEGRRMAKEIGAFSYVECSARDNTGIREVFTSAARASLIPRAVVQLRRKQCVVV